MDKRDIIWDNNFDLLKEYKDNYGKFPVYDEIYKGVKLGLWFHNQRKRVKSGYRKEKLESIGYDFTNIKDKQWRYKYNKLAEYMKKRGNQPSSSTIYDGVKIGQWLYNQKKCKDKEKIKLLEDIGIKIKTFEDYVHDFVKHVHKYTNGEGDEKVLIFIANILYHDGPENLQVIYNLFTQGYCYYFAKMLEEAFPGGRVCLAYPFAHIVYELDGVPYDVNGVTDYEYEELIPIEEIQEIDSFKHNDGKPLEL